MNRKALQQRTKQFHIDIIKLCEKLPRNAAGFELARQVIRSAGSVGANYRGTVRAKSKAELITNNEIKKLIKEADELTAIFAATDKTAKMNKANQTS